MPIKDVYGPTATVAEIDAIVVSEETLAGADAVAKEREKNKLPALERVVIDVIGEGTSKLSGQDIASLKLSSTAIRTRLAEKSRV